MTNSGNTRGSYSRLRYYRRIVSNYVLKGPSHLDFWHEDPEVNDMASPTHLGPYYMKFRGKSLYEGPFDSEGVPMLRYGGAVGTQYNPIAVAQYGLAQYNRFVETGADDYKDNFLRQAEWLASSLESNSFDVPVWQHHFDWEYRSGLKAPWRSGLAQGSAISCLSRAAALTGRPAFEEALRQGFTAFLKDVTEGGVTHHGACGEVRIEEYIVDPPSHILNGALWTLFGVWDYFLHVKDPVSEAFFQRCVETLKADLKRYDIGWWSTYEISPYMLRNVASNYYHRLHCVQLEVIHRITGDDIFDEYSRRWIAYEAKTINRLRVLLHKSAFKILHY